MKLDAGRLAALAAEAGLAGASIVVRRVPTTGPADKASVDPDAVLPAASMIKVPIAAALTTLWSDGVCRPDDSVVVSARNMTANDAASPLVPGYRASLDELGRLMLTRSDNVATNELIDVIGRDRITGFTRGLGLAGTAVRRKLSGNLPLIADPEEQGRNAHPAGDAARLFCMIAGKTISGSDWLFEALAAQEWNIKLSGGLAEGDRFAHKTGDTGEVSHDGGILDLANGSRFIIVVYTALPSSAENDARFARFMRALRPQLA